MTRKVHAMVALAGIAAIGVAGDAAAQVKGTGKSSTSIIRWDDVGGAPVATKAAGTLSGKAAASKVGAAPTGGASTALKLVFQPGPAIDPAKPGFPAGDYILQVETSQTPTGNQDISAFIHLTMSAGGKCTAHAAPTVDGDLLTDWCNLPGNQPCAPDAVDKCTYTSYQVSGSLIALAPGDSMPSASRIRVRKRLANCETGDLNLVGTELRPNDAGAFDPTNHDCADGAVVGVVGIANGDVIP